MCIYTHCEVQTYLYASRSVSKTSSSFDFKYYLKHTSIVKSWNWFHLILSTIDFLGIYRLCYSIEISTLLSTVPCVVTANMTTDPSTNPLLSVGRRRGSLFSTIDDYSFHVWNRNKSLSDRNFIQIWHEPLQFYVR